MRMGVALVFVLACGGGDSSSSECNEGDERPCYQGTSDTRGVGACTDGVELCSAGRWTNTCLGDVTPFVERCNAADDDCNGLVDDVETAGDPCNSADGCTGMRGCSNDVIACLSPGKNECGVCGGDAVSGLGGTCANEVCNGALVCSSDGESAVCNAPQLNACELCGGPAIADLGNPCVATSGCDGARVCNASGTSTTCSCNPFPGQCKDAGGNLRALVSPLPGDLVITEIMASPSAVGDTLGEWFEVRVTRDVDLNQVALDRAGDTAVPNVIESVNCLRVTAGSNLVFARNIDPTMNGGLPAVTARFTFSLVTGSVAAPGDLQVLLDATVLDAVSWTTFPSGTSLQLDPDLIDTTSNDTMANYCASTTTYGAGDLGTPGASNAQCGALPVAGTCTDGGTPRAIVKPAVGALVITELLANPAGSTDAAREWFEIKNTSGAAFDLNELIVARATTAGTKINVPACISIAPAGFGLLARNNDPQQNGMLPAVDATFGFALVDSSGDVEVRDAATVLDAVTYASVSSGVARALDPDFTTTAGNDVAANHCPATVAYGDGTNLGTPRAASGQCP